MNAEHAHCEKGTARLNGDQGAYLDLALAISRGEREDEVLAARARRVTVRAAYGTDQSVIVKLWNLHDFRDTVRRLTGRTKGGQEWAALSRLHPLGVRVPRPLGFFGLRGARARHHQALIVEDLAPCVSLHKHVHMLAHHGNADEIEVFTDRLLRLTRQLIDAGMVDNDHRMENFVIRPDGGVYRVDFENARWLRPGARREEAVGVMLGGLASTYAWATRPDPALARRFTQLALELVRPSDRARDRARVASAEEIARLHTRTGFEMPREIGW